MADGVFEGGCEVKEKVVVRCLRYGWREEFSRLGEEESE